MRWLTGWLRGGADELGWDDLVARVVGAIGELARYRERGRAAFPPDVIVRLEVEPDAVAVIRSIEEAAAARHAEDIARMRALSGRAR